MRNHKNTASLWKESMRIGLPKFDEERKDLTRIIEHLDLNPLHTITSEMFLIKFGIFHAAIKALFKHEEALFREYPVPDDVKKPHLADHSRILEMLNAVYKDSMNKRNQTAFDIYLIIRNEIKQHILKFGQDLRIYISTQK